MGVLEIGCMVVLLSIKRFNVFFRILLMEWYDVCMIKVNEMFLLM